jgi:hypothetical protein
MTVKTMAWLSGKQIRHLNGSLLLNLNDETHPLVGELESYYDMLINLPFFCHNIVIRANRKFY